MSNRKFWRRSLQWLGAGLGALLAILLILVVVGRMALNTDEVPKGALQKSAISKDGTGIAYEQTGNGPPIILVAPHWPIGVERDGSSSGAVLALEAASKLDEYGAHTAL